MSSGGDRRGDAASGYGRVLYVVRPGNREWLLHNMLPVMVGFLIGFGWLYLESLEDPGILTWVGIPFTMFMVLLWVLIGLKVYSHTLTVTTTHVIRRRLRGRQIWPRDELGALRLSNPLVLGVDGDWVFLLDGQRRRLMKAGGVLWTETQLNQVAGAASRTRRINRGDPVSIDRDWPGVLPWSWVHQGKAMLLGGGGVLAGLAVFGVVFWIYLVYIE